MPVFWLNNNIIDLEFDEKEISFVYENFVVNGKVVLFGKKHLMAKLKSELKRVQSAS